MDIYSSFSKATPSQMGFKRQQSEAACRKGNYIDKIRNDFKEGDDYKQLVDQLKNN